jgi:K+-transporting ATPase ATPase A chain
VVQTLGPPVTLQTLEGGVQTVSVGPVASQVAIKQLGTNGGGFFNANSAHPFENPTGVTNIVEIFLLLLIPVSMPFAFGVMIGNRRQGYAIFAAMFLIFLAGMSMAVWAESAGNPLLQHAGVAGGVNMEGKEVRFGIVSSAFMADATTATATGAVNNAHDSLLPLTGLVLLFNMLVGEVIFGGVGVGLIGMMFYVILTMFIASLMVGRTPEFLGKKLAPFDMTMAVIGVLAPGIVLLICGGVAIVLPDALASLTNSGPHGLSEMLYAFASAAGNNGSAFGGLNANTVFFNLVLSAVMLVGRFTTIIPGIVLAGSLAAKRTVPESPAAFPTASPMFVVMLIGVVIIVGALTFFPVLVLGPFLEHLVMIGGI